MAQEALWRAMQFSDLDAVMKVADQVHEDLPEERAIFEERLKLYPQGCLVLELSGQEIAGYAISHPIAPANPPALNQKLGALPAKAQDYYIHDVALLPKLRGSGLARQGIEALLQHAQRYSKVALISVYGTSPFWERFGFKPSAEDMGKKLAPYGEGAVYMARAA